MTAQVENERCRSTRKECRMRKLTDDDLIESNPPTVPSIELVWTAIVDVGSRQDLGRSHDGQRYLVPILGGSFQAGPGYQGLFGIVLPGGADRQLLRRDGVKELDALYEMQISGGPIITIRNRVVVDGDFGPDRYAMSTITAKVEAGPFQWLNRRVLVGTLQSAKPKRQAVIVRAWELLPGADS